MRQIKLGNSEGFALVDDKDFEYLNKWSWQLSNMGYAERCACEKNRKFNLFMHHVVLPKKDGLYTDHINHNRLDNRRENLRYATPIQNVRYAVKSSKAKSKYKGLWFNPKLKKWVVEVSPKGYKKVFVGQYKDEDMAGAAYNIVAKHYYGDFAFQNEVPKEVEVVIKERWFHGKELR